MKTKEFNFDLPEYLVAQYPSKQRGQSRLMTLDRATGLRTHKTISDLPEILNSEKPLLVFNDSKVRKARLIGKIPDTGAETDFLLIGKKEEGKENTAKSKVWKALAKRAKRRKPGSRYVFTNNDNNVIANAEIIGFDGDYLLLEFDNFIDDEWLDKYGHVPLPPYVKRKDETIDSERYQTIYAKDTGSIAAPTAGLHFTKGLLEKLADCGIEFAYITLHVGLGTFLPVYSENIKDHVMHEEQFIITEDNAQKIEKAKNEGRKIIPVGTTSLRTLESAFNGTLLKRGLQNTSLFIYPGYKFKIADSLFTNFHTPESSLLMLVSAFAGKELIMDSYAEAVREKYRFFSYGDAMLIL
ncbi:MAG: tRNA preQ1(34) S-adenosylmethionine ribosyltransferase-isomerase QueA [Treponema sp.]|nr:tRNA preQ1(34) S-adenosylmethionine ribosyltransferase-isomerase QueA [Treponema sp.]